MSKIEKNLWGTIDGMIVYIYTLTNANEVKVRITNYGGTVVSIDVPDRNGSFDDVVLGFDSLEDYLSRSPFFGCLVGRFANRIGKGKMCIDNVEYQLALNDGENHLHGGLKGFDKVVWNSGIVREEGIEVLKLSYFSADGEENYPGNLSVVVNYSLNDDNDFRIDYFAETDKDTAVNLTNHSYFNLSGHASGDILSHVLQLNASGFTPTDTGLIPTGELRSVKGTPMDFTSPYPIGQRIHDKYEPLEIAGGYDHNWVLDCSGDLSRKAGEVYEPVNGRVMELYTTKPGVQLYTGNSLSSLESCKAGAHYRKHGAFCLETQYFPDAVNHPEFPSAILKAGQQYKHSTIYKFTSR
jgi:aldose 1-epimerase